MSIDQDTIRNQVGPFISACTDIIDRLVRENSSDELTSKKLSTAFKELRDNFFKDPDNFHFSSVVERSLLNKSPTIGKDLQELVEVLQGKSENIPLVVLKLDGNGEAGRAPVSATEEELKTIQSAVCEGVAIKINTVITELKELARGKRKDEAGPAENEEESRKAAKAAFEARVAAVRARQALKSTEAGCIQLVSENGLELENLDSVFQNNKNVVLAAVRQNGRALAFAHPRLQNDNEVVREALKDEEDTDFIIEHAGENFKNHREALLELIRTNEMAIGYGNDELVEDKAFILDAIDANPMVIQLLDESLKNDKEIVTRALMAMSLLGQNPAILLQFVGDQLRSFAKAYIRVLINPLHLNHLDELFKNDRDIVLAAVQRNGLALLYAPLALKNDRDIVLIALQRNALALRYASLPLKNDINIVLAAVQRNGLAFQYASKALRSDKRVALEAVQRNGLALQYASEALRNDKEVVLAAVNQNSLAFYYASKALRNDKSLALTLLLNPMNPFFNIFENIGNELKTDHSFLAKISIQLARLSPTRANFNYDFRKLWSPVREVNDEFLDGLANLLKTNWPDNRVTTLNDVNDNDLRLVKEALES